MEFLYSISRLLGYVVVGYLLPKRWRHVVDKESDLAAVIGLFILMAMLAAGSALLVWWYKQ